jgi:hypothetical protein
MPDLGLDREVTLDLPGLRADHLNAAAGDDAVRQALAAARTIPRGQGRSVRLTAPFTLHAALHHSATLAARDAGPAEHKPHRVHATRPCQNLR